DERLERLGREPRRRDRRLEREGRDVWAELLDARRVRGTEVGVPEPALEQGVREPVEQREIRFWQERQVHGRRLRRLRAARIDDDDGRVATVPTDALPEDRVRDAGVRADEDEDVRLFEV